MEGERESMTLFRDTSSLRLDVGDIPNNMPPDNRCSSIDMHNVLAASQFNNADNTSTLAYNLRRNLSLSSFFEFLGFQTPPDAIALQGTDHDEGIFKCVKENDWQGVFKLITNDKHCLQYRDAVGGTPVHVAFLYSHYKLAKAILEKQRDVGTLTYTLSGENIIRYPNTINRPVILEESPYEGQNLLHMAIMHREPELAGWLIDEYPELIDGKLMGKLFEPHRKCYFGSTPLLCALSTNQEEVAKKILSYRNRSHQSEIEPEHCNDEQDLTPEHENLSHKVQKSYANGPAFTRTVSERPTNNPQDYAYYAAPMVPSRNKKRFQRSATTGDEHMPNKLNDSEVKCPFNPMPMLTSNDVGIPPNYSKTVQRACSDRIRPTPTYSGEIDEQSSASYVNHNKSKEYGAIRAFDAMTASILTEDSPDIPVEITKQVDIPNTQDPEQKPHFDRDRIFRPDCYGNTVLHLAVLHNLPNIYDFAIDCAMDILLNADKNITDFVRNVTRTPSQNDMAYLRNFNTPEERESATNKHNLLEFLKQSNGNAYKKMMRFLYARNNDNLSPLTLAAAIGCSDMFTHILRKSSIDAWNYGPTRAYYIPLLELEQPVPLPESRIKHRGCLFRLLRKLPFPFKPKSNEYYRSAIECLCTYETLSSSLSKSFKDMAEVYKKRVEILCSRDVQAIVEKKWNFVGAKQFFLHYTLYCIYLVTLNISLLFGGFGTQPSSFGDLVSWSSFTWLLSRLSDILCISLAATKLIDELNSLVFRFWAYISEAGAGRWDNIVSVTATTSTIIAFILRVSESDDASRRAFTAIALIFGCLYNFFFLLGFQTTGPFIIMIMRMISTDLSRFFLVFIVVLVGFSQAHYVLLDDSGDILKLTGSIRKLFISGIVGEVDYEYRYGDQNIIVQVMMISFLVLVLILLLNLLIAMMGNTYQRIMKDANKRWTAERSNIMQSLRETHRSDQEVENERFLYGFPVKIRRNKHDMYIKLEIHEEKEWREKISGNDFHQCESCYSNNSSVRYQSTNKLL